MQRAALNAIAGIVLVTAIAVAQAPTAGFQTLRAVMVGVEDYDDAQLPDLPNVTKDVLTLEQALSRTGFEVHRVPKSKLLRHEFLTELNKLLSNSQPNDFLMIHVSGHGFTFRSQEWFATSEFAPATNPSLIDETAIPLQKVVAMIEDAKFAKAVLVVSTCRSPLVAGMGEPRQTPQPTDPSRLSIVVATSALQKTEDMDRPGARRLVPALAEFIELKDITLQQALEHAAEAVRAAGLEHPVLPPTGGLDFYLSPPSLERICYSVLMDTIATHKRSSQTSNYTRALEELVRIKPECVDVTGELPGNGRSPQLEEVPQREDWQVGRDGSLEVVNLRRMALKAKVDWQNTSGIAREWWQAFEQQNHDNQATIDALLEELSRRDASITEFFLAYVYSSVDTVEENLKYLDEQRKKRAKEDGTKYIPPRPMPPPQAAGARLSRKPKSVPPTLVPVAKNLHGVEGSPQCVQWWQTAAAALGDQERTWLLLELRALNLNLCDLKESAGAERISGDLGRLIERTSALGVEHRTKQEKDATECNMLFTALTTAPTDRSNDDRIVKFADEHPTLPCSEYLRGQYLWTRSKFDEAAAAFEKAKQMGPQPAQIDHILAIYYFRLDDMSKALLHSKAILAEQPDNTVFLVNTAEIYLHEEMFAKAEELVDQAKNIIERDIARQTKFILETEAELRSRVKATPEMVAERNEQLKSYRQQKDSLLERLRVTDVVMSAIRIGQDKPVEADKAYLRGRAPTASTYQAAEYRCWANAFLGDAERALIDCDLATQYEFTKFEATGYRANALLRLGRLDEALKEIDTAIAVIPNSGLYRFLRGLILSASGRDADAQNEFEFARWMKWRVPRTKWAQISMEVAAEQAAKRSAAKAQRAAIN